MISVNRRAGRFASFAFLYSYTAAYGPIIGMAASRPGMARDITNEMRHEAARYRPLIAVE